MQFILVLSSFLIFNIGAFAASKPFAEARSGSLFSTYEAKSFTLLAPFSKLLNTKLESEKRYFDGIISYKNEDGQTVDTKIKIRVKGKSTRRICQFPKFEIKNVDSPAKQTLFQGLTSVDLNTHCSELHDARVYSNFRASYFNHSEALIYRIMHLLEMPSFKVRPIFITYQDTETPDQLKAAFVSGKSYQAFFLEDTSQLKQDNEFIEIKSPFNQEVYDKNKNYLKHPERYSFQSLSSSNLDQDDVARIALLQYLIGNWDWNLGGSGHGTLYHLWNVKLFKSDSGLSVPIPYDFNNSAFVTGEEAEDYNDEPYFTYAGNESTVKMLRLFLNKKEEILKIVGNNEEMKAAKKLLMQNFYEMELWLKKLEN